MQNFPGGKELKIGKVPLWTSIWLVAQYLTLDVMVYLWRYTIIRLYDVYVLLLLKCAINKLRFCDCTGLGLLLML